MSNKLKTGRIAVRRQSALVGKGIFDEPYPKGVATTTLLLTAQRVQGTLIALAAGDRVGNLYTCVTGTGSGAGFARMALYDSTFAQVGLSADANSLFNAGATGTITVPLSAAYTVQQTGLFYVALLTNLAVTQPTIVRGNAASAAFGAIGAGVIEFWTQDAQASFPATATPSGANATSTWMAAGP